MRMVVYIVAMNVGMRMNDVRFLPAGSERARRAHEACNVHAAEHDQHKSHRKFHRKPDAGGNDEVKKNDGGAHGKDGESMANSQKIPVSAAFSRLR